MRAARSATTAVCARSVAVSIEIDHSQIVPNTINTRKRSRGISPRNHRMPLIIQTIPTPHTPDSVHSRRSIRLLEQHERSAIGSVCGKWRRGGSTDACAIAVARTGASGEITLEHPTRSRVCVSDHARTPSLFPMKAFAASSTSSSSGVKSKDCPHLRSRAVFSR